MYSFLQRKTRDKYAQFVDKTNPKIANPKPIRLCSKLLIFSQKNVYKINQIIGYKVG